MSTPIHFRGTEYANVEAMPPDIRAAYEKLQQGLAQIKRGMERIEKARSNMDAAQGGLPAVGAPTPAWGGPRAPGAVPAPVEFDPVTSLGPATAVFEHDGVRLFPNFGPPHPNVLVVYRDGFAFRAGQDLHTWPWEGIAVIQSNIFRSSTGHGRGWMEHEYTLSKSSGEKVILDSGIKNVEGALESIKPAVFARLLPPLAQAYQAGQPLSFGPVTIHQQNGLQLDGKRYAWETIMDIKVESGRFKITLRDSKKHEARAKDVPNIELLGQLIGLKFYEPALAYY